MKYIQLTVPDDVHKELKIIAAKLGKSMKQLCNERIFGEAKEYPCKNGVHGIDHKEGDTCEMLVGQGFDTIRYKGKPVVVDEKPGETAFMCVKCDLTFKTEDEWSGHAKKKHDIDTADSYIYRCTRCDEDFNSEHDNLRNPHECNKCKLKTQKKTPKPPCDCPAADKRVHLKGCKKA